MRGLVKSTFLLTILYCWIHLFHICTGSTSFPNIQKSKLLSCHLLITTLLYVKLKQLCKSPWIIASAKYLRCKCIYVYNSRLLLVLSPWLCFKLCRICEKLSAENNRLGRTYVKAFLVSLSENASLMALDLEHHRWD